MLTQFIKKISATGINVSSGRDFDLSDKAKLSSCGMVEIEVTCMSGDLHNARIEISNQLKTLGYTENESELANVLQKHTETPRYQEGYYAVLTDNSLKLSVHTSELEVIYSALSNRAGNNLGVHISGGWPLLNEVELNGVLDSNHSVVIELLFSFFCKQVRNRGDLRNEDATYALNLVNYDQLNQELLGVPLSSISKRNYNHLSELAVKYRDIISASYEKAFSKMELDGILTSSKSEEGVVLIKPLTISDIKKLPISKQKSLASNYNLHQLR